VSNPLNVKARVFRILPVSDEPLTDAAATLRDCLDAVVDMQTDERSRCYIDLASGERIMPPDLERYAAAIEWAGHSAPLQ
jgi:hypothetical protein